MRQRRPERIACARGTTAGSDVTLEEGLVIAIEPMLCIGRGRTRVAPDRWTVLTTDSGLAAHFEHSIAFLADSVEILTLPTEEDYR